MIENKELGVVIAENPREEMIKETIDITKKRILEMEINLELAKNGLDYLQKLSSNA